MKTDSFYSELEKHIQTKAIEQIGWFNIDIENFKVLAGSDFYIYGTLAYGGCGCVAGTANVAPKLVVDIFEKYEKGDTSVDCRFSRRHFIRLKYCRHFTGAGTGC